MSPNAYPQSRPPPLARRPWFAGTAPLRLPGRRRVWPTVAGLLLSGTASLLSGPVSAQTGPDTLATAPNVMLLVDTSGSMEWKSSSEKDPVCAPDTPNSGAFTPNEKSRWIELLEVLTGSIDQYSCYEQKRNPSTGFRQEYQLTATPQGVPYDLGYVEPYHRPMSNKCAPGAGDNPWYDASTSVFAFNAPGKSGVKFRPFSGGKIDLGSTCSSFRQLTDGLLDAYDGSIRFGLMTFDSQPDPGIGFSGALPDEPSGIRGTWSYYLTAPSPRSSCQRPDTSGQCLTTLTSGGTVNNPAGCCMGSPWDCPTPSPYEVGARNASAPPWEGRMVPFGPSSADGTQQDSWIQQILLATRPYGATPIAAMLSDARDFFWFDASDDPLNSGQKFGPSGDPLVGKCRDDYIILLTDGEPNTDLRSPCENGTNDSACPYQRAEVIANDLSTSTVHTPVRTFVVGFALGQVGTGAAGTGGIDCATMNIASSCNPTPTDPALRACCVMNQIAFNGTPTALRGKTGEIDHAFFPKTPAELRTAISQVFAVLFKKVAGRTYPVTAMATTSDPVNRAFEFTSGANVQSQGLWRGVLQRRRIVCDSQTPPQPQIIDPPDPIQGDDFVARVNADPDSRQLFTVEPDSLGGSRYATRSVRPFLDATASDGLGHYSGTQAALSTPASFATVVSPETLAVTATTCPSTSATACRTRILGWAAGLTTASPVSRCPQPGAADCSVIGDIFHSVPQIRSGAPAEFLRDETYSRFATSLAKRDTMLYASSNDGFFHAFVVAPGDKTVGPDPMSMKNNERWAFVPPAVLPSFVTMYPFTTSGVMNRLQALDGVPVLKDVVATKGGPRALSASYPFRLERKKFADSTQGEDHTFRTIVVQAFGSRSSGYFALDVTTPLPSASDGTQGPRFLWQLTTDASGNPLFGSGGSTPLVTTLFVNTGLNPEANREVPVAVLAGGYGDPPQASPPDCTNAGVPLPNKDGVTFRTKVRCYPDAPNSRASTAARSLTIVRLDTGQVLRTFRPKGVALPAAFDPTVVTDYTWNEQNQQVDLDIPAPIVGQPVAYPSDTGLLADRLFVGDAEGRVFRVDVSDVDPAKWRMNVFYDAFYDQGQGTAKGTPPSQPLQTPPVVSVDSHGQITLAFSTGDQETLTPDPTFRNYVVSVTETMDPGSDGVTRVFRAQRNWRLALDGGKRVLGPMTLFDKTLYFSTFQQPATLACDSGLESQIWGVDYLLPQQDGAPDSGGKLAETFKPNPRTEQGLVSGVGLRQLPSCVAAPTLSSSTDDFLGYGMLSTITQANPGQFELVVQKSGAKSSGSPTVQTDTIKLTPPITPVTIEGWAPMIE